MIEVSLTPKYTCHMWQMDEKTLNLILYSLRLVRRLDIIDFNPIFLELFNGVRHPKGLMVQELVGGEGESMGISRISILTDDGMATTHEFVLPVSLKTRNPQYRVQR